MKQPPKPKVTVKATKVIIKPKTQEPTYNRLRMGVNLENREMTGENRNDIKPTKRDSMAYKAGYNMGLGGSKGGLNESPVVRMGRNEGKNAKPKPTAKIKKPVVQPKIQIKKLMADNTRVKKTEKDFTPAPKYDRLNYFSKGTPTKSDSVNYKKGYKIGAVGRKVNSPELFNIQKEMGQQEGMDYFNSKSKKK